MSSTNEYLTFIWAGLRSVQGGDHPERGGPRGGSGGRQGSDAIELKPEQVRPAPDFSSSFDTRYITGLGTVDERMLILVDIERLMSAADMALIEQALQ